MSSQLISYRDIWYRLPHGRHRTGDHILYIVCLVSGLTLSMSQPCLHNGSPIGVSGIDLHMADIVQEITYYNQDDGSYAFMVNENGKANYLLPF